VVARHRRRHLLAGNSVGVGFPGTVDIRQNHLVCIPKGSTKVLQEGGGTAKAVGLKHRYHPALTPGSPLLHPIMSKVIGLALAELGRRLGGGPPPSDALLAALRVEGFTALRSGVMEGCFRCNAPWSRVLELAAALNR